MTIQEALDAMRQWTGPSDTEIAHGAADDILCALLRELAHTLDDARYAELVTLYEQVDKWYA